MFYKIRITIVKLLLTLVVLLSVNTFVKGQDDGSPLDTIDFTDNTLVDSELLRVAISDFLTNAQDFSQPEQRQMYDLILAADNVLSRCVSSFEMYRFVYHFMITGFTEMGATLVVDYMMRMPYIEYLDATKEQRAELYDLAEQFNRVKIGSVAPDINALTIKGDAFSLHDAESQFFVILFWSYSCPHCREMLKELASLSKNDDVMIITVNVSGKKKKVKRLLRSLKVNGINICDGLGWESPVVGDFAVNMTPSLFVLDKDKKIVARPFGINEIMEIVR